MDAVVGKSISGSRWVGEGERGTECCLSFVDDQEKKKNKSATTLTVIV